jgi:hypothetical protein
MSSCENARLVLMWPVPTRLRCPRHDCSTARACVEALKNAFPDYIKESPPCSTLVSQHAAMDLHSTAALGCKAYDVLNKYLTDHSDAVLNIEILPPAFPPPNGICMQEDLNLGLPKEILVLAFLEARRRFLANIPLGPLSIVRRFLSATTIDLEQLTVDVASPRGHPTHPPL